MSIRYLAFLFFPIIAFANDQILVVSGGDNPGLNHYSQYLQTKTMYDYLVDKNGEDNVTVFFGMGNNPETKKPFPDVHKIVTVNDDDVDQMIPGIIENNMAATKSNIYQYFFSSDINEMGSQDNLRIFVSDHGLPNLFMNDKSQGEYSDNCIDLWNFDKTLVNNFANKDDFAKVCMSKNALANLLNVVPAKHVIFEMSQCYSGGFHQLSVTDKNGYPTANPKICGFTASTPDHYASGCTATADGPSYQGYERSFTEWYTGISIPTGEMIRNPATNMFSAHQNAVLEDKTVDIPLTTSDYYLLQWAELFDSKNFKSRISGYSGSYVKNIYKNYLKYLVTNNKDYNQFKHLIERDQKLIMAKYPKDRRFFSLTLDGQKKYISNFEKDIAAKNLEVKQKNFFLFNTLMVNTIYPMWRPYVENHSVPGLTSKQYKMEDELYFPIVDNKMLLEPFQAPMLFLQYLAIHENDSDLVDYNENRFDIIESFAINQNLDSLANAVKDAQDLSNQIDQKNDQISQLEKEKQLLRRVYLYKTALAAWSTLIKINDKVALRDLAGLISCEHS